MLCMNVQLQLTHTVNTPGLLPVIFLHDAQRQEGRPAHNRRYSVAQEAPKLLLNPSGLIKLRELWWDTRSKIKPLPADTVAGIMIMASPTPSGHVQLSHHNLFFKR